MKKMLALMIGLSSFVAQAQTVEVTPGPWNVYFGVSKLAPDYANEAACIEGARLLPSPPASSVQAYGCRTITRLIVTQPVCPSAPPSTQQTSCPAGTTGTSFTQTRSVTSVAAPTCWNVGSWSPTEAPASSCPPIVVPPPVGTVLHFSDCGPGAAPGCVQGNNANPGTIALPKQNTNGVSMSCGSDVDGTARTGINCLPAGSQLLHARGGVWQSFELSLHSIMSTRENPLVVDAYGTGPDPLFRVTGSVGIQYGGRWNNVSNDGGYMVRNVQLIGPGGSSVTSLGMWLVQNVHSVTVDNVTIEGFRLAVESSIGVPYGVTGLTIRNSRIRNNRSMGILGSYSSSLIENNTFEGNNFAGSALNHAIYFSNGNDVAIVNNTFTNNSVLNGLCTGGNVTAHGVINRLRIERNKIRAPGATPSCYGFSITDGYAGVREEFLEVIIRDNDVHNVGMSAIAANHAPGILVEGNRIFSNQPDLQQYSIWIPANGGGSSEDARDRDPIVRNNTVCREVITSTNSVPFSVTAPGSVTSGNTLRTGVDATTGVCAP